MENPKLETSNIFSRLIYSNLIELKCIVAVPYAGKTSKFERYHRVSLRHLLCTDLHKFINGLISFPFEINHIFTNEQKVNYFKRHITENKIIHGDDGISNFAMNKLRCMKPDDEVEVVFFEDNLYHEAFQHALEIIQQSQKVDASKNNVS